MLTRIELRRARLRRRGLPPRALSMLALTSFALWGCGEKQQEVIVKTADGVVLTPQDIDREPLALLPRDFLALVWVDARAALHSDFGEPLRALLSAHQHLPATAGFVAERDLQELYVGAYSLQGADFVGVAIGQFDRDKIAQAANAPSSEAARALLVKSEYTGHVLYTVANVGFTVLTDRTLLFGTETGIRRALDRLTEGRLRVELPEWASNLVRTKGAVLAAAGSRPEGTSLPISAKDDALTPLERVRVLANFAPPGLHGVGSLSYPSAEAAGRAAQSLLGWHDRLQALGVVGAALGVRQPITRFETQVVEHDVQFVLELDRDALLQLLQRLTAAR